MGTGAGFGGNLVHGAGEAADGCCQPWPTPRVLSSPAPPDAVSVPACRGFPGSFAKVTEHGSAGGTGVALALIHHEGRVARQSRWIRPDIPVPDDMPMGYRDPRLHPGRGAGDRAGDRGGGGRPDGCGRAEEAGGELGRGRCGRGLAVAGEMEGGRNLPLSGRRRDGYGGDLGRRAGCRRQVRLEHRRHREPGDRRRRQRRAHDEGRALYGGHRFRAPAGDEGSDGSPRLELASRGEAPPRGAGHRIGAGSREASAARAMPRDRKERQGEGRAGRGDGDAQAALRRSGRAPDCRRQPREYGFHRLAGSDQDRARRGGGRRTGRSGGSLRQGFGGFRG